MDTELNEFKSLDAFINLMMQRHPDVFTQFDSFYGYWMAMLQLDPDSFAQLQTLEDYFNLLKQRDPNLFAQFISFDHFFKAMKLNNPNYFALELAERVASPSDYTVHYREVCVALLWKLLTEDRDLCTWQNLPFSTQYTIKTTVLDRIMKEESRLIAFNLCKIAVKLAGSSISGNNNSWPELLPCLYQCVASSTSRVYLKILVFDIFGDLADEIGETVFSDMKHSLHSVLRKTLNDGTLDLDVRVTAMSAAINFILCVSSSNEKERFQDLLPGMMKTLTDSVSRTKEEPFSQKEIPLTYLIKLAKHDPRFLRIQLADVVYTVLDILEAECLEEDVRHEGVEFLITLVEAKQKAPGMVKKLPLFIGQCFAMLLRLLVLGIKDDPGWHSAQDWSDLAVTTSIFCLGCDGLKRFSCALGSKSVAYEAKEQLSAYLAATEWEKRHAALYSLAFIVEGCSEVITKNLDVVMGMVLKCFQDPCARVRWAACMAIAVFFPHFEPLVREEYHNQAYALIALRGVFASNKPEILILHLDGIFDKLLVLLQNEKQMVQQQALKSLAAAAYSVKEHFQTHYDTVMPYLKGVFRNPDLESGLSLRASAAECISAIWLAVGKEKFRDDGVQFMEVLMPLLGLLERADDRNTWYMLRACLRIWECMGLELNIYTYAIIPFIIQCAE